MEIGMGLLDQLEENFHSLLRCELPVIERIGFCGFRMSAEFGCHALHNRSLTGPLRDILVP
jgi:hypothetical protein